MAAIEHLRQAGDAVAALSFDTLTAPELLDVLEHLEADRRRRPAVEHRVIEALRGCALPAELGGKNWTDVLVQRLRISSEDAHRRLKDAKDLGPRTAMTSEPLEPALPNTAKRQAAGEIGAEHVKIIRAFFRKLPAAVDYETREAAEETLAAVAAEQAPEGLRKAAKRLAQLINPDGNFSDIDRARRRYFAMGKQQADGMTPVSGLLDPEAAASLEATFSKLAKPGMCNPEDEKPCVDGEPDEDRVRRDDRTQGQRNHDALKALSRSALASGELGKHNGLPATIIVSTTLKELESAAGLAVTGGKTLLPMRDLIRLAGEAHHYLTIFDDHKEEVLYLGRAKRCASAAQRIALLSKDRGCTRPGCDAPGYQTQVHHINGWASEDGPTDITNLTLACGPDNRLVEEGGWTTRKRKDGRTEWVPPPHLDSGQARVNNFHHPEKYLLPEDDEGP